MGHLDEGQNVFVQSRHIGKLVCQRVDDVGDRTLAVDQQQHLGGALVQLDHALRVEQHVAVLHRFPLQTKAGAQHRRVITHYRVHSAIPRCQALSAVTV